MKGARYEYEKTMEISFRSLSCAAYGNQRIIGLHEV